jgi:hypothetical protein
VNYFLAALVTASMTYFALYPTYPVAMVVITIVAVFGAITWHENITRSQLHNKLTEAIARLDENDQMFDDKVNHFVSGLNLELQKINQITAMLGMNNSLLAKARKQQFVRQADPDVG